MADNVIKVQQAKEMGLEIPRTYELRQLSTHTLNTVSDIGWYVLAKSTNNEFYFCYTIQARKKNRVAIDNELVKQKQQSGQTVKELLVDGGVIQWLVEKYESTSASNSELTKSKAQEIFSQWAWEAVDMGASDVHCIEGSDTSYIGFRIHGLPHDHYEGATKAVSRIIEAGMQLSPTRQSVPDRYKSEDLRITLSRGKRAITLRLSKNGAEPGAHTVFRIIELGPAKTFDELKLPVHVSSQLELMAKKPVGVIVICAPTNHGKSETLSALCNSLDDGRFVQIVSNPIERIYPGRDKRFVQKEVNANDPNRTHEALFETALRQDPDVFSYAEMRNADEAAKVYQAALGAHLMITTFHAADPFAALIRLLDDGISPLVLAEQSRCFASQRLLPELCSSCRIPISNNGVYLRDKSGCSECVMGAVGRRVTAEALVFEKEHMEFIRRADINGLREFVHASGYRTMQADVKRLVEQGVVCPIDAELIVGDVFTPAEFQAFAKEETAA